MMAEPALKRPDPLKLRIISAAVMIPAGLAVVWSGGIALLIASLICGVAMWYEYWTVTTGRKPDIGMAVTAAMMIVALLMTVWFEQPAALIFVGLFGLSFLTFLLLKLKHFAWLALGLTFIGFAVFSLNELRDGNYGRLVLSLMVMAGVWITDIAAYFAGRGFGGPQLSPRGSPNKTWSGAVGAMICTALVGAFFAGLINGPMMVWIGVMASVSVIAQLGDLAQSYWKRRFNVKDSGHLIPGHGGILDRLDSFSAVLIVSGLLLQFEPEFPENFLGLSAL